MKVRNHCVVGTFLVLSRMLIDWGTTTEDEWKRRDCPDEPYEVSTSEHERPSREG